MSDSADLERRYRQLLRCYPRAFRRDHEEEMLSVLLAGADRDQQRPRLGDAVDLIGSAIWMRLRPGIPRSRPTMFWAVRLLYLCAALRLLSVPVLPSRPGHTAYPIEISINWGVLAVLAWANGRGHRWARVLFTAWFALHTVALFYDIAHRSSLTSASAISASVVLWLVELCAAALILTKRSSAHYQQMAAKA